MLFILKRCLLFWIFNNDNGFVIDFLDIIVVKKLRKKKLKIVDEVR